MAVDTSLELIRVGTYLGWPGRDVNMKNGKPSVVDLAKAGFYYTGQGDEVRCFACNLQIGDWERHHDPFVVHATRNPQCAFVLDGSGNKPVYVPPQREYAAIMALLREAGMRVAATATTGSTYSSSTLISDTLTSLYGESMMSLAPRSTTPTRTPVRSHSQSGSPRAHQTDGHPAGREQRPPTASRSSPVSRPASGTPPPRRSSTSDSTGASPSLRPAIQRARSYAADPRTARNSETIANRQTLNPQLDQREFQESEQARLQTFSGWAGIRGATAQEFAQAGFIFIGPPDRVQCVFCNGILRNWNDNDLPLEEHRKHFPNCSFVLEYMSAITIAKPRHPKYKTEPSRLSTYNGWNMNRNPKPAELAKAGFFYVGHGDSVKCFFCDGGLRNWEPNDDPWREHARWFPNCAYVKQSKGQPFIEAVLHDTNLTEYQTASVDETAVKNVARAQSREVDPREVTSRMDSHIVKTVLNMDIPKKLVKEAIRKRLAENGEDFASSEALLEAVFSLDMSKDIGDVGENEATAPKEVKSSDEEARLPSNNSDNQDSLRLAEENRLLKEQRMCKICMDEEVCVAFLPCGHLVCCATCAPALNQCPICRGKIRGTVRTYMS